MVRRFVVYLYAALIVAITVIVVAVVSYKLLDSTSAEDNRVALAILLGIWTGKNVNDEVMQRFNMRRKLDTKK